MIKFSLQCSQGHGFEAWFADSASFDDQRERGLVTCPHCNDASVQKTLMKPNVRGGRDRGKAETASLPAPPQPLPQPQMQAQAQANPAVQTTSAPNNWSPEQVADALTEAGLPSGLFSIVQGDATIGRALCEHPGVAKVSLTGGVDTGKLIIKQSADTLKKVTLELGGKSPLIVFDDANLDDAVGVALSANFYTAGEVCSNGTRVFVHR